MVKTSSWSVKIGLWTLALIALLMGLSAFNVFGVTVTYGILTGILLIAVGAVIFAETVLEGKFGITKPLHAAEILMAIAAFAMGFATLGFFVLPQFLVSISGGLLILLSVILIYELYN